MVEPSRTDLREIMIILRVEWHLLRSWYIYILGCVPENVIIAMIFPIRLRHLEVDHDGDDTRKIVSSVIGLGAAAEHGVLLAPHRFESNSRQL